MSKLARVLVLAAMVAAMNLTAMTAVAQAHTSNDPASTRHRALGRVAFLATGDHAVTAQQQSNGDATVRRLLARERSSVPNGAPTQAAADATHRRLLAQERSYSTWDYQNPAIQQALAQERAYRASGYGNTSAPAPAEPSGLPGWLTPALGVLAAVLALVAGVAVLAARRATRSQRASQAA